MASLRRRGDSPAWTHEIKHDGFRLQVWRDGERVRLFTRRGFDWTRRYPLIVKSARRIAVTRFLIDGEMVCWGEDDGFERLRSRDRDVALLLDHMRQLRPLVRH
jgi:bifunctional non-homologous end joining protein LigD